MAKASPSWVLQDAARLAGRHESDGTNWWELAAPLEDLAQQEAYRGGGEGVGL